MIKNHYTMKIIVVSLLLLIILVTFYTNYSLSRVTAREETNGLEPTISVKTISYTSDNMITSYVDESQSFISEDNNSYISDEYYYECTINK